METDNRRERGFTLVEVGVTLGIVGVLAVLAIPNFRGVIERYRYTASIETMSTDLNLARLRAISRNREVKMQVDKTLEAYYTFEGNKPDGSDSWTQKTTQKLPNGVDVYNVESMTGDSVIYRPDGAVDEHLEATPDGIGRIYLRGASGTQVKRIVISAVTGRVTVERNTGGAWKDDRYTKE